MSGTTNAISATPVVVKLGGRALEHPEALATFLGEAATLRARLVLVHGGGAEVNAWCARAGVDTRFIDGLRVTSPPTLEIATAVLAGLANKRLVAALRAAGADAVGLAALDGGIAKAARHPDHVRLGEVGVVESVDTRLIGMLLAAGSLPVLASIGARDGALLNLNADDVAAALAVALGAPLVLLSDTPGVLIDGRVVSRLDERQAAALLAHPEVQGGMRHKLAVAHDAVAAGVPLVRIAQWSAGVTLATLLASSGPGTSLSAGAGATTHDLPPLPIGEPS